jgi:arylsulfatase A-like enzyme
VQPAASPGKPFFLYLALGAAHWPHQAPRAYVERHRGRYDRGWDVAREEALARQIAMSIVPAGTTLPSRNDDAPAWGDLTPDERRLAARHMKVYADFLEHADAQVGRLFGWLRNHVMFDDTLVVPLSDNGASNEGDRLGCVNVAKAFMAQIPAPIEVGLDALSWRPDVASAGTSNTIEDSHVASEYNFGEVRYRAVGVTPVSAGRHMVAWSFARTGPRRGIGTLAVDSVTVATIDLPNTWPYVAGQKG